MRKIFLILLNTFVCAVLCAVTIINLVNVLELDNIGFTLDFSLLYMRKGYIYIVWMIAAAVFFVTALAMFSRSSKKKLDDDQKNFSHLSSYHEAKKGLVRVQFHKKNGSWQYNEASFLCTVDKVLNPFKKGINAVLTFFKVDDRHKLNTVKKWDIDGEKKIMRSGLPVIMPRFRRHTMFLEANDVHSLIIGTTNSGKTMSEILQMIETIRMAKESVVINDAKGELYENTAKQFKDDGYEVIRLNFVNPEASDDWGVLQYAWNKWKEAHDQYEIELEEWNKEGRSLNSGEKAAWLSRKPEPDYSIAIEYLTDMANILTYEANVKDSFWNESAADLLVGEAAYLMEECTGNKNVSDDFINFKSLKLGVDLGEDTLTKDQIAALGIKSKNVMGALLELGRSPDSLSSMKLKDYCDAPEQTRKSIKKVFNTKISLLTMNEQIMRMTSSSSFSLENLGKKKMAIYMIVHDEKKTYYPLVTLFVKQLYETLINEARGNFGRLPIPVNVILDEFGNCPPLKDIQNMLTAGRARGVRFVFAVQDTSQLTDIYGREVAQTIQNNCSNTVYILGSQPETLKNFSSMCGSRQVWLPARQMYESRPLISTDRLSHMNLGEVVIHRQRKSPFITRMIPYNKCKFYCGKNADPNEAVPKKKKVAWLNPKNLLNDYANIF